MSSLALAPASVPTTRRRPPRLRLELRRHTDHRAPRVLLVVSLALAALLVVLVPLGGGGVATTGDLTSLAFLPARHLLPVLAVLGVTAEIGKYGTGPLTYVLDPHRSRVLTAKYAAAAVIGAVTGAACWAIALLAALVLRVDLDADGVVRSLGAMVVAYALITLAGSALAAALQSAVGAIVTVLVLPQLLPQLLAAFEATAPLAPYTDLGTPLSMIVAGMRPDDPVASGVAVGLWILLPALVGYLRTERTLVG